MLKVNNENKALDILKFLACILVAGAHAGQLFPSETMVLLYKQWVVRFCVPFFFLSSGFFFSKTGNKFRTIKRVLILFVCSYLLYLPNILKRSDGRLVSTLLWNAIFGYEHLWYISAMLEGLLIWYVAEKLPLISTLFRKIGLPAAMVLLLVGALTDEYYPLLDEGPITMLAHFLIPYGGPRNVVFFGFPMLMIGGGLAQYESSLRKIPTRWLVLSLVLFSAVSFGECVFLLAKLGSHISNDITLFNIWPAAFLFLLSFRMEPNISASLGKQLRKMSEYVYVLHMIVLEWLRQCLHLPAMLLLAAAVVLCVAIGMLTEKMMRAVKSRSKV